MVNLLQSLRGNASLSTDKTMKKIIYILVLLLAVAACKKNIVPKPDKFLDEKQMENLLYDLAVLESMKVSQVQKLDSLQFNSQQFIYKKYQIDSISLAQNMVYYASFPKEYDTIVKKVEKRIKLQRDSIDKVINTPKDVKKEEQLKEELIKEPTQ